jgi:hypothetical protein
MFSCILAMANIGTCQRAYNYPLFFVPVSSALLSGKDFKLSFLVSDVTKTDSTISIDVYGLGIRQTTDVLDSDWYLGPSASAPASATLIQGAFINGATVGLASYTVDSGSLTTYLNSLPINSQSSGYVVLRLFGSSDLGCSSSCGAACPTARIFLNNTASSLTYVSYGSSASTASSATSTTVVLSAVAGAVAVGSTVAGAAWYFMKQKHSFKKPHRRPQFLTYEQDVELQEVKNPAYAF